MDLGAYAQIEDLEELVAKNGISVPRLRGYRLMKNEKPVKVKEPVAFGYFAYDLLEWWFVKGAVRKYISWHLSDYSRTKNKRWANRWVRLCTDTGSHIEKYYDYYGGDRNKPFPWHKFHGKLRKALKLLYKQCSGRTEKQYTAFNKYCGRDDVLYIHARIGGDNWKYFNGDEVAKQPWFLEKVDDAFDCTYCDIYAKLNEVDNEKI